MSEGSDIIDNEEAEEEEPDFFYVFKWSCDDVADWIEKLGFPYYRVSFFFL